MRAVMSNLPFPCTTIQRSFLVLCAATSAAVKVGRSDMASKRWIKATCSKQFVKPSCSVAFCLCNRWRLGDC